MMLRLFLYSEYFRGVIKMLSNIRKILIVCAVVIILILAGIIACLLSFKPTETPAYGLSGKTYSSSLASDSSAISDSLQSDKSTSSTIVSESVAQSSSSASENNSASSEPDVTNNPRLRELQLRLTYGEHWKLKLSENQQALADSSLFVGDSICSGFSSYGLTSWKNSYAAGSVGTRNFFESEIKYFGEVKSYIDALSEKKPEHIFLWMGMNDVNMISAEQYAKNYKEIIDYSLENSQAEVCVFAMTPVNSDFTPNERITLFNNSLKDMITENYSERVHYIDFAYVVTDSRGMLCEDYDAGDGVHLAPDVYYLAMIEICDQLGIPS